MNSTGEKKLQSIKNVINETNYKTNLIAAVQITTLKLRNYNKLYQPVFQETKDEKTIIYHAYHIIFCDMFNGYESLGRMIYKDKVKFFRLGYN